MLSDDEFLLALASCTLPAPEFGHIGHLRAGYLYLCQLNFDQALQRIRAAIKGYARHLGKPDIYHETITVAYLALIQRCMFEHGRGADWPQFRGQNPELLRRDLLLDYYPRAELDSELARRIFVLPRSSDRLKMG